MIKNTNLISDFIQVMLIDNSANMAYFSYIILKMRRVESGEVQTMGVLPTPSGIDLYYNPEYISKLKYKEFRYVLMHEIMHVVNRHSDREIKKYNHTFNNICMDLAVNSILGKQNLPEGGLYPGAPPFQNIPENKSYEEYTELLKKNKDPQGGKDGDGEKGEILIQGGDSEGPGDRDGLSHRSNSGPDFSGHDLRRSKGKSMSKEERDMANNTVSNISKQAYENAKSRGGLSSDFEELIKSTFEHKINWKKYLKNWVGENVYMDTEPSIRYRNKHYPKFHGIIPGNKKKFSSPILVAIDTSGSISPNELSMFLGEINAIKYPKVIVECDADIKQVVNVGAKKLRDIKIKGRGGTDFVPVFKYAEKLKYRNIIFFTDMDGSFPKEKPKCNTLWVSTGRDEAPFGKVIKLK